MTSPEEPRQTDPRDRARRWIWIGGAAVGLWFVGDGLLGIWPDASTSTRVIIVVAVLLGLAAAGAGALYLARRDRAG